MELSELEADERALRFGTLNLLLQGITLASKSLLLLVLVRYLSPAELGVFGIMVVTLNLSMYLVGLDFHTFAMRELVRVGPAEAPRLIRDQFAFHAVTYAAILPLLLLIFTGRILPWSLAAFFYGLLVLDHSAQELQRILVTLQRPVHAAAIFFLRGGSWVIGVFGLMAWDPRTRNVQTVAGAWMIGAGLSLVLACVWLRDLPWRRGLAAPVDWTWLRSGVRVSLRFLTGTLALRGIFSIDRYALQHYAGTEAVGVYTFFTSARNAIQSFLDLGVLAVMTPRIVHARQAGQLVEYRRLLRRLRMGVAGLSVGLCLIAAVAIYPLLSFVGNPLYRQNLAAYWVVLGMTLVAALGDIPHVRLYASHRDHAIVVSTLAGLGVAVALNLVLVPRHGLLGAAAATLVACAAVGGSKAWFARERA